MHISAQIVDRPSLSSIRKKLYMRTLSLSEFIIGNSLSTRSWTRARIRISLLFSRRHSTTCSLNVWVRATCITEVVSYRNSWCATAPKRQLPSPRILWALQWRWSSRTISMDDFKRLKRWMYNRQVDWHTIWSDDKIAEWIVTSSVSRRKCSSVHIKMRMVASLTCMYRVT